MRHDMVSAEKNADYLLLYFVVGVSLAVLHLPPAPRSRLWIAACVRHRLHMLTLPTQKKLLSF